MKKIVTILLLIISANCFSQTDSLKIKELETKIDSLNNSVKELKQDEASMYVLKNNLINDKLDYQKIDKKIDDAHQNWFTKYFDVGILIGGFLSLIGFSLFSIKQIKNRISENLAKLTDRDVAFVTKNIDELIKHTNLIIDAKILILNETDTDFPEGFKKVMKLYGVNTSVDKIDVKGLKDTLKSENIALMKDADMVIIENQVEKDKYGNEKHWVIKTSKFFKTIKQLEENSIEGTQEDRQPYENNLSLIELSNSICDNTAIVYYGQAGKGNFPSNLVNQDIQHMITFANAPSQLYGNMLNMLKFQSELKNAK